GVDFAESLFEKGDAGADVLRAWVVRAVGKPRRDVTRTQCVGDGNAIHNVINRAAANGEVWIANGAVLVFLVLKDIRISGTWADREFLCEAPDTRNIGEAVRQIPLHVESERFAGSSDGVDLSGVGEFFFDGRGSGGLNKFPEASAGIGETPRRKLDAEAI